MTDSTLNRFLASGTTTQRLAFVPDPPTPASGPSPSYLWWDTTLQAEYAYNFGTSAWIAVGGGGAGTVTTTGSPASGNLTVFSGATSITSGDLSGDITTSGTLATTISNNAIITAKITNANVTLAKVSNATANSVLVGSGATGSGASYSEITLGAGLTMTGATLSASGTASGQLLNIRKFTSGTTYTPTAGAASIVIELQGGGGGGAGSGAAAAGTVNIGSPANGGAWLRARITSNFSGATYAIGGAGSGGAAGANDGTNGGNTTFTTTGGSPVTYTASGGLKGVASTGNFAPPYLSQASVTTATATNGDAARSGGQGGISGAYTSFFYMAGYGGSSYYSPGAPFNSVENGSTNGSAAGINDPGPYGGGGGGAVVAGSGSTQPGGNGSPGVIIIYEYS